MTDLIEHLPHRKGPSLIVAVGHGGAIGRGGELPWHLPEDLSHFKRVTQGHVVLLGSATWSSIGRALPGRHLLVVSRHELELPEGVEWAADPDDALDRAESIDPTPVVAGGARIYDALRDRVVRAYLTEVDLTVVDPDTFFPPLDPAAWAEVAAWSGDDDRLSFRVLDRR